MSYIRLSRIWSKENTSHRQVLNVIHCIWLCKFTDTTNLQTTVWFDYKCHFTPHQEALRSPKVWRTVVFVFSHGWVVQLSSVWSADQLATAAWRWVAFPQKLTSTIATLPSFKWMVELAFSLQHLIWPEQTLRVRHPIFSFTRFDPH